MFARASELLEDDRGRLSMTRLIVLLTWPPATWVLLQDTDQLVNYLSIYVGGYAIGKASDIFKNNVANPSTEIMETSTTRINRSASVAARSPNSGPCVPERKLKGNGKGGA